MNGSIVKFSQPLKAVSFCVLIVAAWVYRGTKLLTERQTNRTTCVSPHANPHWGVTSFFLLHTYRLYYCTEGIQRVLKPGIHGKVARALLLFFISITRMVCLTHITNFLTKLFPLRNKLESGNTLKHAQL